MDRQNHLNLSCLKQSATRLIRNGLDRPSFRALSFIMTLSLLSLVQCRSELSESDYLGMILESKPGCTAPCWIGIVPGVSTEADFLNAVQAVPRERFDELKRNTLSGRQASQYIWRDRTMRSLMSSRLEDNLLSHIHIQTETAINLQSVLDIFGIPQAYATYVLFGERQYLFLYLFYEVLGIVVETNIPMDNVEIIDCHYDLPSDLPSLTLIDGLFLFSPAEANDALNSLQRVVPSRLIPRPWGGTRDLELSSCPEWLDGDS